MGLGLLNANLFMKLPSYHRPKKKLWGPWALGPRKKIWGPWAHGLKRETLGALGPSDLSLMALALSFSCVVALCSVPSLMALAPGP